MSPVGFVNGIKLPRWKPTLIIFLENSQVITAGESYLRASMYYRSAEFYAFFSEPNKKEHWEKSKECFREGAKLLKELMEKFPNSTLKMNSRKLPVLHWPWLVKVKEMNQLNRPKNSMMVLVENKTMHIFTAQEGANSHYQISNMALMNGLFFNWLDDVLG